MPMIRLCHWKLHVHLVGICLFYLSSRVPFPSSLVYVSDANGEKLASIKKKTTGINCIDTEWNWWSNSMLKKIHRWNRNHTKDYFDTYPMYSLAHDDSNVFIIYSFIFGIISNYKHTHTHICWQITVISFANIIDSCEYLFLKMFHCLFSAPYQVKSCEAEERKRTLATCSSKIKVTFLVFRRPYVKFMRSHFFRLF